MSNFKKHSLPALSLLTWIAAFSCAYSTGAEGRHRGWEEGELGRGQKREERKGEALACAQQLGITLPSKDANGNVVPLTADQRQQLQSCVQQQRQQIIQSQEQRQQSELQACAQQVGVTLPVPGTQSSSPALTVDQRTQLRACLRQDRKQDHQSFEQSVQACLASKGITNPPSGRHHQKIDSATRQAIDECVQQAAVSGSSGSITSSSATTTTVSTVTDSAIATDTSTSASVLQ